MPNEPERLNYIRGLEDGKLPILSGEPLTDEDRTPFKEAEVDLFNTRFEAIFKWINNQGIAPIVTKEHYNKLLFLAECQKKLFNDESFTGDGVGGWGMRDIIPEDVYGDGPGFLGGDATWQLGNGVVAGNWNVGAVATRFARNDMGFTQRNAGTFQAGASMVTLDANQDRWAVAYFGMADLNSLGLIQGHVVAFSNRERDFYEFTNQMELSNITYADLGKVIYFNHKHPFKSGNIIRPVTVAPGALLATAQAMRPVGIAFISQRRALQLNTMTRPAQA